jgi:formylglycine-generating enzyme required for sulfatase activity
MIPHAERESAFQTFRRADGMLKYQASMIRHFVIVTLVCFSLVSASAAEPQRWAILVGVDDYVNLQDLRFCGNDAVALADSFKQSGFDERRVVLLHDKAEEARFRPFKANIEQQLTNVLGLAGPDDLVIVSFSGHGIHKDGKSYLCPNEANDLRPAETMIAVDEVYQKFAECRAALKLLLVDACRNEPTPPGRKSATPEADRQSLAAAFERPPEGIIVLASCAPKQISWEDEGLKHGVFMHHVLKGLGGAADGNRNGRVSLPELYEFASNETKVHVLNRFNDIQVPALRGEINGVFEWPRTLEMATNSIGMKLILMPAGEFMMGSNDGENWEKPVHRVRITKPFFISAHEVTQAQWREVMETAPWTGMEYVREGDDYPATYVRWGDALEFCRKLSAQEGKTYVLPSEAQWEYACRAGTTTRYSFGDDESQLREFAWRSGVVGDGDGKSEYFAHLVGSKRPNPWGLYDMHGNVWEWCNDRYDSEYYGKSQLDNPENNTSGTNRVKRGGGWFGSPTSLRAATRASDFGNHQADDLGFRPVLIP